MMINLQELIKREGEGLITRRKHPTLDLYIWNYSPETQWNRKWDEYTRQARGLITDAEGAVLARPFNKFFNLNEMPETMLSNLPPEVPQITSKEDGCLHFSTPIMLSDGTYEQIGRIVRNKKINYVMGYDHKNKLFKSVKILRKFNNRHKDNWILLNTSHSYQHKSGGMNKTQQMRVTDNHKFWDGNKYKPISTFKIGDVIYCYQKRLSNIQKQILLGSLLGDSSIKLQSSGKTASFCGGNKRDHLEYVKLKRKVLGDLIAGELKPLISGYGTIIERYSTFSSLEFCDLRKEWYPKGKKIVPRDLSWLTPLAVAFWYMDDGCTSDGKYQREYGYISTDGFSKIDNIRLVKALLKLFPGLKAKVVKTCRNSKIHYHIRINAGTKDDMAIENFWKSLAPYFPICMQYKLPKKYRTGIKSILENIEFKTEVFLRKEKIAGISYDIKNDDALDNSKCAYDLETETHNYFAKGILIHNSMGIQYYDGDKVCVATRGSFESEQAQWATNWIQNTKKLTRGDFLVGFTYIYEIIYPQNRIVIDYQGREELILLAVIDNETGQEHRLQHEASRLNFNTPNIQPHTNVEALIPLLPTLDGNQEGFVVKYKNGLRVKMKGAEYLRLHKLLTQTSSISIWENLKTSKNESEFTQKIVGIPDEFYKWVYNTKNNIQEKYDRIEFNARLILNKVKSLPTRKEQAMKIMSINKELSSIVFNMLDGRDYSETIWKMVRPEYELPFRDVQ